jgi:hypothetical protein
LHDFGNRPALGRPFSHFSRHPETPLVLLFSRCRFPYRRQVLCLGEGITVTMTPPSDTP